MKMSLNLVSLSLVLALGISACGKQPANSNDSATAGESGDVAVADADNSESTEKSDLIAIMRPTEGNTANGIVAFIGQDEGVLVRAEIFDASPGQHGFHIHAIGDCSAPDASSAGGHFTGGERPHGSPQNMADKRHVGDLGNVAIGEDGTATYERLDTVMEIGGENSIRGRAVVLHAGQDDLTSQPSGAAGPRVACGVIE